LSTRVATLPPEPTPPTPPPLVTVEAAGLWQIDTPPPRPVVYPMAPSAPRLQYLASYSLTDSRVRPYGLAFRDGELQFGDLGTGAVGVADLRSGRLELRRPADSELPFAALQLGFGPAGERVVLDREHKTVIAHTASGELLWAREASDRDPGAVAVSGEHVFVGDLSKHRIEVLDLATGRELRAFGEEGRGEGQLGWPVSLAIDPDGNLLVCDMLTCQIQRFSPQGELLGRFGEQSTARGSFTRPKGIACDRDGRIYVVDSVFHNVQVFDPEGKLLISFGEPGAERGSLRLPAQITIDYENVGLYRERVAPGYEVEYLIAVTNQSGPRKVVVYGFLKETEGGDRD
jgi:hypothetical protein